MRLNKDFVEKGYAFVPQVLDKESCDFLTRYLFKCVYDDKDWWHDNQCPKSYAVNGANKKPFQELLIRMKPVMETLTGLSLLKTYHFSRLYQPNDVLIEHTDREACEISMTLTLGFEGNVWGFYANDKKFDMNVGDAVIYRGMDIPHRRDKYIEGKWQSQIFLHYVDANGKYTAHEDDKIILKG